MPGHLTAPKYLLLESGGSIDNKHRQSSTISFFRKRRFFVGGSLPAPSLTWGSAAVFLSRCGIAIASYPGRAAREGTCGGGATWGGSRRRPRPGGLVYTNPEVPKIWVLVIFCKLLCKTFRKRIRNHRSRPFLFLQRCDKRVRCCPVVRPVFS